MVHRNIKSFPGETLYFAALVSRLWRDLFFNKAHSNLVMEAYRRDEMSSTVPPGPTDTRTFSELRQKIKNLKTMTDATQSLVLRGPTAARVYRNSVRGVTLNNPRISLCLVKAIIKIFPNLKELHLVNVQWESCTPMERPPHEHIISENNRHQFHIVRLSNVQCQEEAAHPLMILKLASKVDQLFLDFVEGPPVPQDIFPIPIRHVTFTAAFPEMDYSLQSITQWPSNAFSSLSIRNLGSEDLRIISRLLRDQIPGLLELELQFPVSIHGACLAFSEFAQFPGTYRILTVPLDEVWGYLQIADFAYLQKFSIQISLDPSTLADHELMIDLLLSSLIRVRGAIVHLAITFELPLVPALHLCDILSDTNWAALNRAISRFSHMTHFTLECKYFNMPEVDDDNCISRDMRSSSVATLLQLLPFLISKYIFSMIQDSKYSNFLIP